MTYSEAIDLLIRLGFEEFDRKKGWHFDHDIDLHQSDRLFTDKGGRNAIYIRISENEDDLPIGPYYYDVYVLEDIGCGCIPLPFRWTYLEEEWIRNLQNAFGNLKN